MAVQLDIATLVLMFITLAQHRKGGFTSGRGEIADVLPGAVDSSMYRNKSSQKQSAAHSTARQILPIV